MSVCVSSGSVHSAVRFAQKQRTISAKLSIAAACKLSEPNVKYENAKQASTQQQQRLQQQQQHSDQAHLFDTKTITKKKRKRKKSSKRKEQTITMCVCVCFGKRQFCAQFAITHSSSHSIAVRRRSLIECLPAGERERERTRTMPACLSAWHARSLYLVMLPHVLALPSIHSLSLSCSLSWPAAQAATKAAAAAAATSFQLRWHSTHSSLVR